MKLKDLLLVADCIYHVFFKSEIASISGLPYEEIKKEQLKDFSVVTFKHKVNGKDLGTIGIIGPKRMDYSKVVSVLDYIGKTLNVLPEADNDEKHKQ